MALEDFMNDLNGGFQGMGMGAQLVGGMQTAKFAAASNPWVAGSIMAGGALLGAANANDPAKKRAGRINNRMGEQEIEINDLDIMGKRNQQALDVDKRRTWEQFGGMFSKYLAGMGAPRGL